jgi:hypothetical protein
MRCKVDCLKLRLLAVLLSAFTCSDLFAACPDANATIASACPELYAELDRAGLVDALDLAPDSSSDAQTVSQLERYLAAARQPEQKQSGLDETQLDRVITDNYRAAKRKELSFMERLSAWWDSLWDKGDDAGPNVDFWKKFIPTETFARALFYALSGLLAALLLVYGWRELQPFLAARRSAVAKLKAKPQKITETWPPKLSQLPANVALAKAYASLVRLLTERKKLPDVPGLTHAELAQAFANQALAQAQATQRFSGISAHAAKALFTEHAVSAEDLASFLSQATTLVAASAPGVSTPEKAVKHA